MRRIIAAVLVIFTLVLGSCQKEIDWSVPGTDGDLLVKALQVTPSTNDTNIVTFDWDAGKRLLLYKSAGKVNGTATNITNAITRLSDGKIKNIVSKSTLTAGFLDSTVYGFHYSGTQLAYVIDTQYTLIGAIRDSMAFTYKSGKVYAKETFTDFLGFISQTSRETFTYDANGNLTIDSVYTPDGSGGFDPGSVTTYTYSNHKNAVVLGEESYAVIGPANVSPNYYTVMVTNAVSSGTTYTTTNSQTNYNSYDRPSETSLTVTPVPPGYDLKLTFFYQ